MKNFLSANKTFIGIILVTLLLLVGGVFFFSKGGAATSTPNKVSDTVLTPDGVYKTGGIVNGIYQPASSTASGTLVEFGDYECPACGEYHPLVKQLLTELSGKVNFVFRNFPLPQHNNAKISAYAAEAAGLQNKFWEMHDKIYENQASWSDSTDAKTIFIDYAKDLGLNLDQFKKDIDSQAVSDKVNAGLADGNLVGINSTPTYYINGIKLDLPGSYADFKKVVTDAITNNPIVQSPAPEAYHIHFDLKVYINGSQVNLGLAKYQSTETKELDANIHLHDGNGSVVHVHKQGVPLSELFSSIKLTFPANSATSSLKIYVNGSEDSTGLTYIPQDLDKILVSYGPTKDSNIINQVASVTDLSCIYSLKCPERGKPPTEGCVGGLGTGCTK